MLVSTYPLLRCCKLLGLFPLLFVHDCRGWQVSDSFCSRSPRLRVGESWSQLSQNVTVVVHVVSQDYGMLSTLSDGRITIIVIECKECR